MDWKKRRNLWGIGHGQAIDEILQFAACGFASRKRLDKLEQCH